MISYDVKSEQTIEYGDYSIVVREYQTEEEEPTRFDFCVVSPDESETDYVGPVASEAEAIKQGKAWADDIQHEQETDFVQEAEAFTGKLGTSLDYAWIVEGLTNLGNYTDDDVEATVDFQATVLIDQVADDYEEKYSQKLTMSLEDFKVWSDYKYALKNMMRRRDQARDEQQLNEVMTPKEIAEEFGVKEDTVRDACQQADAKGAAWCRKSGATWLILRKHAEQRWAKK